MWRTGAVAARPANRRRIRAFRLRNSWCSQPSDTQARPSSASLSDSVTAAGAGLLAGFFGLGGWRKPYPAASVRQASVARPVVSITAARVQPSSVPPASQDGSRIMASPTTPPSPAGNGQPVTRGRHAAQAAASITPRIQSSTRRLSRQSARWVRSRQPQIAIGSTIAIAAMPNSCISRSAPTAPGMPSKLRIGALVAWLSDGSLTDQVVSASPKPSASRISAMPPNSRSRRLSCSRSESDRRPRPSRPRSMARMQLHPSRLGSDAAAGPRRDIEP